MNCSQSSVSIGKRAPVIAGAAGIGAAAYWSMMSSQSQLLGRFPARGLPGTVGPKTVALTFDDGPNEPFTSELLQLLGARDVQATFFQVGRAVERFADVSRALLDAGHVLGNHSYSHQFHRCLTELAIDDEIRHTQDVFGELLDVQPRLYRPPWLVRTPATFRLLRRHNLQPVSGTFCHPLEVAQIDARRIAARAVARTRPASMIIFHDGYNGSGAARHQTLDAVARVIDDLAASGWSFTTVDAMLGVKAYG